MNDFGLQIKRAIWNNKQKFDQPFVVIPKCNRLYDEMTFSLKADGNFVDGRIKL